MRLLFKDVQITLQFEWGRLQAMKNAFLMGSSPEFEIAAYTICALTEIKECILVRENNQISIKIETITPPGGTMKIKSVIITQYSGKPTTTKKTTPKPTKPPADQARLQQLVDEMRAADVDKPIDYILNWGNPATANEDVSPEPLFTFVNESLFERPVYKTLIDVYTNGGFIPDQTETLDGEYVQVCNAEPPLVSGDAREKLLRKFFDTYTNTTVFQLAFNYLKETNYIVDWASLKRKLWTYWFGTYTRCKGPAGSSGFEHVFIGEWKATKVDGQHCWVYFYRLEKEHKVNYYGYISHLEQLTGTTKYTWEKYLKPIGGFNIGTSPAFDFTIFSVCALTRSGGNKCRFTLDGFPVGVTSYLQDCANTNETCIATAYPTN
ncbi:unnamed protein product [Toxocara canis]|uniref:Endoribonuclease n=1 Tax=Toxocara canis TaxID=6265 RepID=A0A183UIW5_TOXCA|nr:unnamed protein product [Toxocara canis]